MFVLSTCISTHVRDLTCIEFIPSRQVATAIDRFRMDLGTHPARTPSVCAGATTSCSLVLHGGGTSRTHATVRVNTVRYLSVGSSEYRS